MINQFMLAVTMIIVGELFVTGFGVFLGIVTLVLLFIDILITIASDMRTRRQHIKNLWKLDETIKLLKIAVKHIEESESERKNIKKSKNK